MVCCYSYAYVVAWLVFCYVTMSFCLCRYISSEVYVKDFPIWLPGTILKVKGPLSYHVTLQDSHVLRRHVNHIYRLNLSPLHWMMLTCSQNDEAAKPAEAHDSWELFLTAPHEWAILQIDTIPPTELCGHLREEGCSIWNLIELARLMVWRYGYGCAVAWPIFCYVTMTFCLHTYISLDSFVVVSSELIVLWAGCW